MATDIPKGWSIHPGTLRPTWRDPNKPERNEAVPSLTEWMDNLPDGDESALFEDSLGARYPLINRECPFDD